MSRKPFDQNPVVPFARPASADLNLITSYSRQALMYFLQQLYSRRTSASLDTSQVQQGFIGDAFKIRPLDVPVLAVSMTAGIGFQYAPSDVPTNLDSGAPNGPIAGLDDLSGYKPLVNPTALNIPIYTPLPGVGNSRYDIIEVRFRREFTDYSQDLVFDPIANDFLPKSAPQALTWAMDLNQIGYVLTPSNSTLPVGYKVGAEALTGTQVEPPTTPGYIKIARILVTAGDTATIGTDLLDTRAVAGISEINAVVDMDTTSGGSVKPTLISYVGPGGVQMIIRGGASASAQMDVFLVGGASFTLASLTAQATTASGIDTGKVIAAQITRNAGDPATLDAFYQAQLADPTITANPSDFSLGAPFRKFIVYTVVQAAGVTAPPTGTPAVIRYVLQAKVAT